MFQRFISLQIRWILSSPKALVAITLMTSAGVASAQSSGFAVSGAGTASCGQYLESRSDDSLSHMHVTWAQGFLSGLNVAEYTTVKSPFVVLPDGPTISAYLDKFCREHPLESPMMGALAMFRGKNRRDAGMP